jgi:drug/metabolite transporter (DMT)-like permease
VSPIPAEHERQVRSVIVPVLAALAGAAVYGVTGVLQQRATRRVKGSTTDQVRFARGLLRQRKWLLSTLGTVIGFALQGLALGTGPIALVQPLLVTGLLFAGITGFILRRQPIDWPWLGWLLLTAGGLALFLAMARPSGGAEEPRPGAILTMGAGLVVVVVACVLWALRARGVSRSLSLALATGVVYGCTAAVAKLTIEAFTSGVPVGLSHWSTWTLVMIGPLGFLLNQNAFREGALASPAVAVITVTDPLVAIGIGVLWLGDTLTPGPAPIVVEVLGLAAMAVGVWFVAHRAPQVAGAAAYSSGAVQPSTSPGVDA